MARVDVLKHSLVPKHEVISEDEVNSLLEGFSITKGQLPKILVTDPVVKKIKAKAGDVVKITRESKTAGTAVMYRVVVAE
jgi:DNA-directed RNA polymerase subunit H